MLIQLQSPTGDTVYLESTHITAIQETNTDRTSSYVYLGGGFALIIDGSPEEVMDAIDQQRGHKTATVKPLTTDDYPQIGE
jgi:hypothetical protein